MNCKTNIEYKINPGDTYTVPQFCELTGASYYPVVTWSPSDDTYVNNNTPFNQRFDSVVIKFEDNRQDIPELLIRDNQCIVHITRSGASIKCYIQYEGKQVYIVQVPWGIFSQSQWLVVSAYAMGLTAFSMGTTHKHYFFGVNTSETRIAPCYGSSRLFWPQVINHRFYIAHIWFVRQYENWNDMPRYLIDKSISNVYNGLNLEYQTSLYNNTLVTLPYEMDITMSDNKVYTVLVYSMTSLIDFSNTSDKNFLNEITVIKNNEQSKIMVV